MLLARWRRQVPRRLVGGVAVATGLVLAGGAAPAIAALSTRPASASRPASTESPAMSVGTLPSVTVPSSPTDHSSAPPTASSRRRLVVADAGNYILFDAEPAIAAALEGAGFFPHTIGGFGLSWYPEVWRGVLGHDVPSDNPAVVVVMMGNSDFALARRDPNEYRKRLDEAVWRMTVRGAKVLWLGLPPLPPNVEDEVGRQTVNGLYAELPRRFPGKVRYVSTDNVLGFGGVWVRSMPDDPSQEPIRKVKPDGAPDEHVCPAGAVRVAQLVRTELDAMVGGVPPESSGWQGGAWRDDLRYDDPPRACRALPSVSSTLGSLLG
jgi:hypothetical protein